MYKPCKLPRLMPVGDGIVAQVEAGLSERFVHAVHRLLLRVPLHAVQLCQPILV